ILQKTVDEVGVALNAANCALRVEGSSSEQALTYFYFDELAEKTADKLSQDLDRHCLRLAERQDVIVHDSDDEVESEAPQAPFAVVPLVFHERLMGALQVTAADPGRLWHENEIL